MRLAADRRTLSVAAPPSTTIRRCSLRQGPSRYCAGCLKTPQYRLVLDSLVLAVWCWDQATAGQSSPMCFGLALSAGLGHQL